MGFIFNQAEIEINDSTLDLASGNYYAHLVTIAPSVTATVTGELVVPNVVNYTYKQLNGLDYVPNLKWSFANVTWPTLTYTAAPVGVVICKQINATPGSLDRVICFNETSQTLSTGTYSLTQYFILTGIIQLAVDPYINNVRLHILFEGDDNSTSFADINGNSVLVRDGAPLIKSIRSLYGRGSLYFNGSSSLKVLQSSTFAATTQDFSLELIIYPTTISTSGVQGLFDTRDSISNNPHLVFINNNNSVKGLITNRTNINSNNVNSIVGLKANEWQKLSICRYQGYTTIYINDIPVASEEDTNNYLALGDLIIGDILDTSAPFDGRFVGYLQSIRLTVGVARLTSQYSNSSLSNGDKGDITLTNNGSTWTIDDGSVTLNKVQTVASNTLLGRYSTGSGTVQSIAIGNNLQLLGSTLVGITNLIPADVRDSLQTLTGVNRLDNAYIKNGSPYFTPTDIRGALESLSLNNRLDAVYIKNIPIETYSTPTSLRNGLQSLTGTDRLDASAIQNSSPYITALDLRNGLQTLSGVNRLDALYIKNLPTGTYNTPVDVRDALQTLTGTARLDASAIQNLPNAFSTGTSNVLSFSSDGDTNGLFYWLGTNKGTATWSNPAAQLIYSRSGAGLYDNFNNLTNRVVDPDPDNTWTETSEYIRVNLGSTIKIIPNYVSIRSWVNNDRLPRNFNIIASNDGTTWDTLLTVVNNTTITGNSQWLSLPIPGISNSYQMLGYLCTSPGDSNNVIEVALSEWEFYGTVVIGSGNLNDGNKGDITVGNVGTVWTLNNNSVELANFQQIPTSSLLGRSTSNTGNLEVLTIGAGLQLTGTTLSSSGSAYTQATAPTGTPAGTIWIDTSTNVITGWQLISTNYAVIAGDKLVIDCTNPITLLLPANPVSGNEFELTKYAGAATVSIDTNGKNFNGSVPLNLRYTGNSAIADTSDKIVYINNTIGWISMRKQIKPAVTLTYVSDGDTNGLVYYLGTNALTTTFTNPATNGALSVIASSTELGVTTNVTDRLVGTWHTTNTAGSWIAWSVNNNYALSISKYTLRNRLNASTSSLRNWVLEGTNTVLTFDVAGLNASAWTSIDTRISDATITTINQYYSLTANGSSAAYRYLRLRSTGFDSSDTNYLCLGEIEFYGTLSFN